MHSAKETGVFTDFVGCDEVFLEKTRFLELRVEYIADDVKDIRYWLLWFNDWYLLLILSLLIRVGGGRRSLKPSFCRYPPQFALWLWVSGLYLADFLGLIENNLPLLTTKLDPHKKVL